MTWKDWLRYYQSNCLTALPAVADDGGLPDDPHARRSLARSLAVFQLGEAGEGRIAKEVWGIHRPSIDDDYRSALVLFVREEGRHARILGRCVRALGAEELRATWTNDLFRRARRAGGRLPGAFHLKLLVLLAAEVVGITFYDLLARELPGGSLKDALRFIREEEVPHLEFHARFFTLEARTPAGRVLFTVAWALVGMAAGLAVLVDHAGTLRFMGIPLSEAFRGFAGLLTETARAVIEGRPPRVPGATWAGLDPTRRALARTPPALVPADFFDDLRNAS